MAAPRQCREPPNASTGCQRARIPKIRTTTTITKTTTTRKEEAEEEALAAGCCAFKCVRVSALVCVRVRRGVLSVRSRWDRRRESEREREIGNRLARGFKTSSRTTLSNLFRPILLTNTQIEPTCLHPLEEGLPGARDMESAIGGIKSDRHYV